MPERQLMAIFEMHEEYFRHVAVRVQVINIEKHNRQFILLNSILNFGSKNKRIM